MKHKYSIVVCTYNNVGSLRNTLHCLSSQTIPPDRDIEIIVVDNNSQDETTAYCQEFAALCRLPLRCLFEGNQGLSYARNKGGTEACGDVLLFTDDDILVPEDWLEEYVRVFEEQKADVVFGRIIPEWRGSIPSWYHESLSAVYGALDYGPDPFLVSSRKNEFYGANFGITKRLLSTVGWFDPNLGRKPDRLYISEERQVFLKALAHAAKIVYNPKIYVHHVISERMKTPDYLRQYYSDTAASLVYCANANPKRQLLGIPYFRLVEFLLFYFKLMPRAISYVATRRAKELHVLRLELLRQNRMISLYWRNIFSSDFEIE